jgi:hypothetical protein
MDRSVAQHEYNSGFCGECKKPSLIPTLLPEGEGLFTPRPPGDGPGVREDVGAIQSDVKF